MNAKELDDLLFEQRLACSVAVLRVCESFCATHSTTEAALARLLCTDAAKAALEAPSKMPNWVHLWIDP